MKTWNPLTIYILTDPRTGRVRYVGATHDIDQRFKDHEAYQTTSPGPRRDWMAELKAAGVKPICDVLESSMDLDFAAERKWIAFYIACGADLVNVVGTLSYKRHLPRYGPPTEQVRHLQQRRETRRREYCRPRVGGIAVAS